MSPSLQACLLLSLLGMACAPLKAEGPRLLKENGGWCWFQDPRAIVVGDQVWFASVAGTAGRGSEAGDAQVTAWNLKTNQITTATLHPQFEKDDHAVPSLLELPDGRVQAGYARHRANGFFQRTTLKPNDASAWGPEAKTDITFCYTNFAMLGSENNRIYAFYRGLGFNPNYLVSDDLGKTYRYGGRFLQWVWPGASDPKASNPGGSGRPYVRYTNNGQDTVHFITTEDHPRNYDNSIYHGFVRDGAIHGSDGTVAGPLSTTEKSTVGPTDLTRVFEGDADHVAWTTDIELDRQGNPYIAFSVQRGGAPFRMETKTASNDHRYYYGRWDGTAWQVHEMAYGGSALYTPEVDYTGLVALDPDDPDTVVISTDADPKTGTPLVSTADGQRHHEIFKGVTADGGATWTWTALTANSTTQNLRPIIPKGADGQRVILWLQGRYTTYTDYDQNVMGLVEAR